MNGEEGTVRMICPFCKTNEHVDPPGVTGEGFSCWTASKVIACLIFQTTIREALHRSKCGCNNACACPSVLCPLHHHGTMFLVEVGRAEQLARLGRDAMLNFEFCGCPLNWEALTLVGRVLAVPSTCPKLFADKEYFIPRKC